MSWRENMDVTRRYGDISSSLPFWQSATVRDKDWCVYRLYFLLVESVGSQHTWRMNMVDVCWVHYLCFLTTHLMITMLCMIHRELFFLFNFFLINRLLPLCLTGTCFLCWKHHMERDRDNKIILKITTKWENITVTKQNKELPSIPLCVYHTTKTCPTL